MINDSALLQHVYANYAGPFMIPSGCFNNLLRMSYLRHSAYAIAHKMDYYNIQADSYPELLAEGGAWAKVAMMKEALDKGYKYVFWVDADALIMDFSVDLRDAVKDCEIGACIHDPDKSEWLKKNGILKHINIGVIYLKNTPGTKKFVDLWLAAYPGPERWADQGAFNKLMEEYPGVVKPIDDKWNATVKVNEVEKPVIKGYHGVPYAERYTMMKAETRYDPLIYRT